MKNKVIIKTIELNEEDLKNDNEIIIDLSELTDKDNKAKKAKKDDKSKKNITIKIKLD